MGNNKPYGKRTDLAKVQAQWHKLSGLHSSDEWSAAVVRAATAAELAANFAIRAEFKARSKFDDAFVNSLLKWANGLAGKLEKLLVPLSETDETKLKAMKTLRSAAEKINRKRNAIAHQGEFCNEREATAIIEKTREFITALVHLYEPKFALKERKS
jgi:hypothetical protein